MIRMDWAASQETDDAAVERTLAGERDAYGVLVERHSRRLYRLAYRMTGNAHDAEEVVQEAFLRAYQKLDQYASRANFGTWIYRIAANFAIDRMRQRRGEESRRENPPVDGSAEAERHPMNLAPDPKPSPERLAHSSELRKRMEEALDALTEAERTAFVMRHQEGCGIEEIAKVLKSSAGAAKNTVFRSIQKLRKTLEPMVEDRGAERAMTAASASGPGGDS